MIGRGFVLSCTQHAPFVMFYSRRSPRPTAPLHCTGRGMPDLRGPMMQDTHTHTRASPPHTSHEPLLALPTPPKNMHTPGGTNVPQDLAMAVETLSGALDFAEAKHILGQSTPSISPLSLSSLRVSIRWCRIHACTGALRAFLPSRLRFTCFRTPPRSIQSTLPDRPPPALPPKP